MTTEYHSLLRQIEESYSNEYNIIERYQFKWLLFCLQQQKPQLLILRYLQKLENQQTLNRPYLQEGEEVEHIQDELFKYKYSTDKIIELEVFDETQQKKKLIQIYILSLSLKQSDLLKQCAQIAQSFIQSNLILELIDHYALHSNGAYFDNDFYILEFEMYDFTLREYLSMFKVENEEISPLLKKYSKHCENVLKINNCLNFYENPNSKYTVDDFYIKIEESNKFQLKLNLFNFSACYCDHRNSPVNLESIIINNNKLLYSQIQENQLKKEQIVQYSQFQVKNKFKDFHEQIDHYSSRKEFSELIKNGQLDPLKLHDPAIFEYISEHPKYHQFKILTINKTKFIFSIKKIQDDRCIVLEGRKQISAQIAEKYEKYYKSLIDSSSAKEITNLLGIELVSVGKQSYLILEKEVNEERASIDSILLQQQLFCPTDYNICCDMFRDPIFTLVKNILFLSYNLYKTHQIQITGINPQTLVVSQHSLDKQLTFEGFTCSPQFKEMRFKVEDLNEQDEERQDFKKDYSDILISNSKKCFEFSHIEKENDFFFEIERFFESISQSNKEAIDRSYQNLSQYLTRIYEILEIETLINKRKDDRIIEINFADRQLQKLNIFIDNKDSDRLVYKMVSSLIEKNQISHFELAGNFSQNFVDMSHLIIQKPIHRNIKQDNSLMTPIFPKKLPPVKNQILKNNSIPISNQSITNKNYDGRVKSIHPINPISKTSTGVGVKLNPINKIPIITQHNDVYGHSQHSYYDTDKDYPELLDHLNNKCDQYSNQILPQSPFLSNNLSNSNNQKQKECNIFTTKQQFQGKDQIVNKISNSNLPAKLQEKKFSNQKNNEMFPQSSLSQLDNYSKKEDQKQKERLITTKQVNQNNLQYVDKNNCISFSAISEQKIIQKSYQQVVNKSISLSNQQQAHDISPYITQKKKNSIQLKLNSIQPHYKQPIKPDQNCDQKYCSFIKAFESELILLKDQNTLKSLSLKLDSVFEICNAIRQAYDESTSLLLNLKQLQKFEIRHQFNQNERHIEDIYKFIRDLINKMKNLNSFCFTSDFNQYQYQQVKRFMQKSKRLVHIEINYLYGYGQHLN